MSTTPRTPLFWPRMKVRGHRNRAKLAARYTRRDVLNVILSNVDPEGGRFEFINVPAERATHRITVQRETRDGFGRIVAAPLPRYSRPEPVKPTAPAPPASGQKPFSLNLNLAMDAAAQRDLFDSILGRPVSRDAS